MLRRTEVRRAYVVARVDQGRGGVRTPDADDVRDIYRARRLVECAAVGGLGHAPECLIERGRTAEAAGALSAYLDDAERHLLTGIAEKALGEVSKPPHASDRESGRRPGGLR